MIDNLLSEVSDLILKYKENEETKHRYNILDVTGIRYKEVLICKLIAALLNPRGTHGYKGDFLNLFIQNVLRINDFDLNSAKVHTEYLIDGNRRIDIVIENKNLFIPIEVKIYAKDQENQCLDYYRYAIKKDKIAKVFYLTLDGHEPTEVEEIKDKIVLITFNQICGWLKDCENIITEQNEVMFSVSQIKHAIERTLGKMDDSLKKDISKAISANATSIESAIAIKNTLNDAFIQKMNELFKCFKEVISKELPELELIESESDYKKLTSAYYDKKSSTNPRISYKIKSFDDEVVFRIEIDYRMFWGIYSDKDTLSQNTISQLKKHFGITEKPRDEEWLYWEYMPENREDSCPNFKQENQALLDLFDDKLLDDFIKTSVNEIKNRLKEFI